MFSILFLIQGFFSSHLFDNLVFFLPGILIISLVFSYFYFKIISKALSQFKTAYRQAEAHSFDLLQLSQVLQECQGLKNIETLFEKISSFLFIKFGFEGAMLALYRGKGENPIVSAFSMLPEFQDVCKEKIGKPYPFVLIDNLNRMNFISDFSSKLIKSNENQKFTSFLKIKSFLQIPLKTKESCVGFLTLTTHSASLSLKPKEIQSLDFFISQILPIIRNIKSNEDAMASHKELETFGEIVRKISSFFNFDEIIKEIADYLKNTYGFEGLGLGLVDKNRQNYIVEIWQMPKRSFLNRIEIRKGDKFSLDPLKGGIASVTILSNRPLFVTDIDTTYFPQSMDKDIVEEYQIKSVLHMPIPVENEVIGSFTLTASSRSISITPENIQSIQKFTAQIGVILKNKKLYQEIEAKKNELSLFNDITKDLILSLDFVSVFNKIIEYLKNTFSFEGFGLSFVQKDLKTYKVEIYRLPERLKHEQEKMEGKYFPLNFEKGGRIGETILEKKMSYFPDVRPELIENPLNRKVAEDLELRTALNIPLLVGEEVIGAFSLFSHSTPIFLKEEDLDSITRFVAQISVVVRNSKLYDEIEEARNKLLEKERMISEDMALARQIQGNLLPFSFSHIQNLQIKTIYQPHNEIGGDIYDIFEMEEGIIRVFIADAIGHGIQAALATMLIKSEYEKIKNTSSSPSDILSHLNQVFYKQYFNLSIFFSCFTAEIDFYEKKIFYASAGHPPQYLMRGNEIHKLGKNSKMIGMLEKTVYHYYDINFEKNDRLLFYTDGLTEEFNSTGDEFGDTGLLSFIQNNSYLPLENFIHSLRESLKDFVGKPFFQDDLTAVGIQILQ